MRAAAAIASFLIYAGTNCEAVKAAVIVQDTLETAVSAPVDLTGQDDFFTIYAAERYLYDDNVYRLSSDITDLQALSGIGSHASRQDHIDTTTLGLDGQWSRGRQTFIVDLNADDNRFNINDNLNNISHNDKVQWNWDLNGLLTGQVGATYNSGLAGFVNATVYSRNIIDTTSYFSSARYQVGPRWAFFGGILDSGTTLSAPASQVNDYRSKSAEFGTEFVATVKTTTGLGYRHTDGRYPQSATGSENFREDIAYFYAKHEFTEKTSINGSAGYLQRDYSNSFIDSFSGLVWSLSLQWKPTDKIQLGADAWRRLQAYVTAQSDYFVSKGGSIAPRWVASEKIAFSLFLSVEYQDYIGRPAFSDLSLVARRDTVSLSQAKFAYTPNRFLIVDLAYGYQKRNSNLQHLSFDDILAGATATLKF